MKRNTGELGRPNSFLAVEVSEADIKTGKLMTSWESDQLIVLSERESRLQGEGADADTKPTKETLTVHEGTDTSANLTVGDSEQGS